MSCDCILLREMPYRGPCGLLGHQDHHSGPTANETQKESKPADEEEEEEEEEIVRLLARLLLLLLILGSRMLKLIDGILVGNGCSFSLRLIFELLYPRGGMFITYLHHFINDTDRQWSL